MKYTCQAYTERSSSLSSLCQLVINLTLICPVLLHTLFWDSWFHLQEFLLSVRKQRCQHYWHSGPIVWHGPHMQRIYHSAAGVLLFLEHETDCSAGRNWGVERRKRFKLLTDVIFCLTTVYVIQLYKQNGSVVIVMRWVYK